MTPLIIRYPLDPSGTNPNNLVRDEDHTLVRRNVRCIALNYGAFFTESIVIRDKLTNRTLVKNKDYYCTELYEVFSLKYGKEICAIVVITDKTCGDIVTAQYQTLGSEYGTSATAIIQQLERLNLDNRPTKWGSIIGKPSDFKPSMHLHDVGDIYGFEYVVSAIERLKEAIMLGDAASHDSIYAYIDKIEAAILAGMLSTQNELTNHKNDKSNPHGTTAEQLSVYTKIQTDGFINALTNSLNNHKNDKANPHNTTAAQVGAYTKAQTDSLIAGLDAGLDAHKNDKSNPHGTTAEQVGTYTKAIIDGKIKVVQDDLNAHKGDKANPHGTTAAQVGAYSIGQIDSFFAGINSGLNAHVSNHNNPHGVTAEQVGTYVKNVIDEKINAVQYNLDVHKGNGNNPHNVTAAQVGTYAAWQIDNLFNAAMAHSNGHVADLGNPHHTTAAQVGAYSIDQSNSLYAGKLSSPGGVDFHRPNESNIYVLMNGSWNEIITASRFNDFWDQRLGQRMSFSY